MKQLLFMLAVLVSLPASAGSPSASSGCPMSNAEELIRANVVCDIGLIAGEWSSECQQYKIDLAVYLATLGFWDKPPKCWQRDMSCNKTGKAKKSTVATSYCTDEYTGITNEECLKGKNINDMDCDEKETLEEQETCQVQLAQVNNACNELTGVAKEKCLGTYVEPVTYNSSSSTSSSSSSASSSFY